jgi:hypothetical protein
MAAAAFCGDLGRRREIKKGVSGAAAVHSLALGAHSHQFAPDEEKPLSAEFLPASNSANDVSLLIRERVRDLCRGRNNHL